MPALTKTEKTLLAACGLLFPPTTIPSLLYLGRQWNLRRGRKRALRIAERQLSERLTAYEALRRAMDGELRAIATLALPEPERALIRQQVENKYLQRIQDLFE